MGKCLSAGAGDHWDDCVEQALGANCAGIECLAGIPGTVGGTPVQNVGAYGQEVASVIERVRAFDRADAGVRGVCERGVRICLSPQPVQLDGSRTVYCDARGLPAAPEWRANDYLCGSEGAFRWTGRRRRSLVEVAEAVRGSGESKGMLLVEGDPDCRSAGSFFKNPMVHRRCRARAADCGGRWRCGCALFPAEGGLVKIPAAWLIEQAGFRKGYALGAAGISSRHTLALINRGGATAEEILALAKKIRRRSKSDSGSGWRWSRRWWASNSFSSAVRCARARLRGPRRRGRARRGGLRAAARLQRRWRMRR